MVQNINAQKQSQYGSIDRVGTSPDGRGIYQVIGNDGKIAGGLSIAQKDCDTFERSYQNILEAAPKLEQYMKTHTEDDIKNLQKKGKWIIGGGALLGGLIPALTSHKLTGNTFLQVLITIAGTVVGLFAGAKIGAKVMTPPGAKEMSEATKTISKLDIQPIR